MQIGKPPVKAKQRIVVGTLPVTKYPNLSHTR
jgi:hypothetical protein